MAIFIPISCLKINPPVICTESEVGDRWGVLGRRQAVVAGRQEAAGRDSRDQQRLMLPACRHKAPETPVLGKGRGCVDYTPEVQ